MGKRYINRLPLTHPSWEPSPPPRHVPWLGIEPATFQFTDRCSIHWATPAQAVILYFWWTLKKLKILALSFWTKSCLKSYILFFNILLTFLSLLLLIENMHLALAGIAQWIECGLGTKRSLVRFPVRAHAWVAGQVPSREHVRGNHTLIFFSLSFSLPLSLKINKLTPPQKKPRNN